MDNFEIIRPFGPTIVKLKMPVEMISEMNNYVDTIIKDKEKSQKLNYGKNLIGKVQQEFLMEVDFMKKIRWAEFLGSNVQRWLSSETDNKIEKFELIRSWIVRQFQNDYNPIHYHSGHISGVGYLKVPKNLGTTGQKSKKTNVSKQLGF